MKPTQKFDEEVKKNKEINKLLNQTKKVRKFNILILGTGDAGKSTFLRQLRVNCGGGMPAVERQRFINVLRDNCLTAIQKVLIAAKDFNIPISEEHEANINAIISSNELSSILLACVGTAWFSDLISETLKKHNLLQIPGGISGIKYFVENAERFSNPHFEPTDDDIARAKLRTTGINEVTIRVEEEEINLIDVGGQRSERRKWLHCFTIVNAVIFIVALNEYDMVLEEDGITNRLLESLKLFQLLTGTTCLSEKAWILFLNKSDLFETEIKHVPIANFFPEYTEFEKQCSSSNTQTQSQCDIGIEFIKSLFVSQVKTGKVYAYTTCAVDRYQCERIFQVVRREVLEHSFELVGL
uniref:Uncharacterized protein n=1 Tax=Arcella intermedia TaxID=1963864 RepID=A0A6B2L842_9EUKA